MSTSVSDKLYNFATALVGNRVFDLYLKYMGIKTLTSATLDNSNPFGAVAR